jgi:hypothetical protein
VFDIRIICDPADTDRIVAALDKTFTTGTVTVCPTRDGKQHRFYVRADHRTEPGPWPTPEAAYAFAPSIVREIGWTVGTAVDKPHGEASGREYWLRKAALLDRIALDDEAGGRRTDASELALNAARFLIGLDGAAGLGPDDPRGYVRRAYARYTHTESE